MRWSRWLRAVLAPLLLGAVTACAGPNPEFDGPDGDGGSDATVPQGGRDTGPSDAQPAPVDRPPPPQDLRAPDGPKNTADDVHPPVDLLTGLVGYWTMDEPAGSTVARDRSGLGNDGTLERLNASGCWVAGRFGSALKLPDDKNVGVRVPLTSRIAGLQQYTIAAWVRRIRLRPTAYQSIISRQLGTGINEVFDLSVSKDVLQAYAPDRTTSGVTSAMVNRPIPVNVWFHAAATHDGQNIRVYLDGVLESSVTWTGGLPTSDRPLYLGTNKNESGNSDAHHALEGELDEVVLYDVALPETAVAALASGQRPPVP